MWFSPMLDQYKYLPSCQILIPRTSRGRPPSTSPGRSLKLLFNHPGDVPIWRPWDVLIYLQGMSLGGWFRTSPGRSQDVRYRTFKARLRDDVGSCTGCPKISFYLSTNLSKSHSTLKVYWEPSRTSKMEHFRRNQLSTFT